MERRTRLFILITCLVAFLILAPYIVLYSLGYRIDFVNRTLVTTGGIYVRVFPDNATVTIDNETQNKTGLFSNSVFVQNLLPAEHHVTITKDGYQTYQKSLPVLGNTVTKLENITLFKDHTNFSVFKKGVNYINGSPDGNNLLFAVPTETGTVFTFVNAENQIQQTFTLGMAGKINTVQWSTDNTALLINMNGGYTLINLAATPIAAIPEPALIGSTSQQFNPENSNEIFYLKNKNLYSTLQTASIIKAVAAYQIQGQTVTWLSTDGFLSQYNLSAKTTIKINLTAYPMKKASVYTIKNVQNLVVIQEDNALLAYNGALQQFTPLSAPIIKWLPSGDNQKLAYCNANGIMVWHFAKPAPDSIITNNPGIITDCYWLNNDYILFATANSLAITEIDNRGNVNIAPLVSASPDTTIAKPAIFLNNQSKRLYVLSQNTLLVSDRLTPP